MTVMEILGVKKANLTKEGIVFTYEGNIFSPPSKPFCMMRNEFKRMENDAREQYWRMINSGVKADYIMDVETKPHAEFKDGILTFVPPEKKKKTA